MQSQTWLSIWSTTRDMSGILPDDLVTVLNQIMFRDKGNLNHGLIQNISSSWLYHNAIVYFTHTFLLMCITICLSKDLVTPALVTVTYWTNINKYRWKTPLQGVTTTRFECSSSNPKTVSVALPGTEFNYLSEFLLHFHFQFSPGFEIRFVLLMLAQWMWWWSFEYPIPSVVFDKL